jgi:sulfonate transport system substrate-binding protein
MITKTKKHLKTYVTMVIALINILFISTNSYADKPRVITIDYAYYNPVSLLMKDRGSLEESFKKDGIKIRWVLSLGSNKALEYL